MPIFCKHIVVLKALFDHGILFGFGHGVPFILVHESETDELHGLLLLFLWGPLRLPKRRSPLADLIIGMSFNCRRAVRRANCPNPVGLPPFPRTFAAA
jgi:hypothetical protein